MLKRGLIKLNIQRGAGVAEFAQFLSDLDAAYLALQFLPLKSGRRLYPWRPAFSIDYHELDFFASNRDARIGPDIYPDDRLEISRISIQSPGWVELLGSLNPLQQLREYLKDRHERKKDCDWRSEAEKDRARLENEVLRSQAERERTSAIGEFYDLLERMDIGPEERQRIMWDRLGRPMMQIGHHQDTGLLGSQDDETDRVEAYKPTSD